MTSIKLCQRTTKKCLLKTNTKTTLISE